MSLKTDRAHLPASFLGYPEPLLQGTSPYYPLEKVLSGLTLSPQQLWTLSIPLSVGLHLLLPQGSLQMLILSPSVSALPEDRVCGSIYCRGYFFPFWISFLPGSVPISQGPKIICTSRWPELPSTTHICSPIPVTCICIHLGNLSGHMRNLKRPHHQDPVYLFQ